MDQKRRAVELEKQDVAARTEQNDRDLDNVKRTVAQITLDNEARRNVLR